MSAEGAAVQGSGWVASSLFPPFNFIGSFPYSGLLCLCKSTLSQMPMSQIFTKQKLKSRLCWQRKVPMGVGVEEGDKPEEGFHVRSGITVVLKNANIRDGLHINVKLSKVQRCANCCEYLRPVFLEKGIEGRLDKDYFRRIKENGFIDVRNRKGKFEYRVTDESLMDCLTTNNHEACLSIHKNCRVLTVHGSKDRIVHVTEVSEFAKYIKNHLLCVIEGADNEFTSYQHQLASISFSFFKLGPKKDDESGDISTSNQDSMRSVFLILQI